MAYEPYASPPGPSSRTHSMGLNFVAFRSHARVSSLSLAGSLPASSTLGFRSLLHHLRCRSGPRPQGSKCLHHSHYVDCAPSVSLLHRTAVFCSTTWMVDLLHSYALSQLLRCLTLCRTGRALAPLQAGVFHRRSLHPELIPNHGPRHDGPAKAS